MAEVENTVISRKFSVILCQNYIECRCYPPIFSAIFLMNPPLQRTPKPPLVLLISLGFLFYRISNFYFFLLFALQPRALKPSYLGFLWADFNDL